MDDWQDAALSTRHMHNRIGKQGRGKGGRSNGAFNVQRALGTYEIKCPAAEKLPRAEGLGMPAPAKLEMFNLNDLGNALVGQLIIPEVLHGTVLMAGSRKTLKVAIENLQEDGAENEEVEVLESESSIKANDDPIRADGSNEDSDELIEDPHDRVDEFEKNSFRSPKFWLKWQGQVTALSEEPAEDFVTDTGYVVFSGNTCEKFSGTLSCASLDWNNVKITGRKITSRPARDFTVHWVNSQS